MRETRCRSTCIFAYLITVIQSYLTGYNQLLPSLFSLLLWRLMSASAIKITHLIAMFQLVSLTCEERSLWYILASSVPVSSYSIMYCFTHNGSCALALSVSKIPGTLENSFAVFILSGQCYQSCSQNVEGWGAAATVPHFKWNCLPAVQLHGKFLFFFTLFRWNFKRISYMLI